MRRGDLVTIALAGDFGKPYPALVIRSDRFADTGSVSVLLLSSTLVEAPLMRIPVQPSSTTGLRTTSHVMVDKCMTVRRDRIGGVIGRADDETMLAVTRSLAVFLGIA